MATAKTTDEKIADLDDEIQAVMKEEIAATAGFSKRKNDLTAKRDDLLHEQVIETALAGIPEEKRAAALAKFKEG